MNDLYKNDKFLIYYDYLISENKKYNLTAITDKKEVYLKHFYDSLSLNKIVDLNNKSLCDVGSGAGFPGIPLKICCPSLELQIVEPTLKRVNFMKNLLEKLSISDVKLINERAEVCVKNYREKFDIVTARAVASFPVLLELLVGFIKLNGYIILYKGDKGLLEIKEGQNALKILGCCVEQVFEYELPENAGKRMLIKIKREKETNLKYPRRYAEIKAKPL